MKVLDDLLYSRSHEWLRKDGETFVVGITDYAQHELGDVVFVELPEVGRVVKKGEPFGAVESVKSVSDLTAPVSGEVTAVNAETVKIPESINRDPYGKAWLIRVKVSDDSEIRDLMSAESYRQHTGEDS